MTIEQGKVFEVDMFALPLGDIAAPQKLTITVAIEGTEYRNDYEIWVYPPKVDTERAAGRDGHGQFHGRRDAKASRRRRQGPAASEAGRAAAQHQGLVPDRLLVFPHVPPRCRARGIEVAPGTLGFLCDPKTPALAEFPTEFHSNWQWWHLVKNSRPIILDDTPADYRPIVQVIDNFERNHKLGLIVETKVGQGKMLVCAIDLLGQQDKPEARQLLHSLLRYLDSAAFAPKAELDVDFLTKLFPGV